MQMNNIADNSLRYTKPRRIKRPATPVAVGDELYTDWWEENTKVRVIEICADGSQGHSESGVLVRVETLQGRRMAPAWYDANWFGELK